MPPVLHVCSRYREHPGPDLRLSRSLAEVQACAAAAAPKHTGSLLARMLEQYVSTLMCALM